MQGLLGLITTPRMENSWSLVALQIPTLVVSRTVWTSKKYAHGMSLIASSTSAYTAADVLSLPLSSSALVSSRSLPKSLTGSTLAVSDFGLASDSSGKIYLAGGQSSSGDLVSLDTIGVWDSTNGWQSQTTSGDVPDGRVGASLVAHPNLDML